MNSEQNEDFERCASTMHLERIGDIIWVKGQVVDNRPHKHHAFQVAWAMPDTELRLQTEDNEVQGHTVAVDGGVAHSLSMEQGVIALIDSGSLVAAWLREQFLCEGTAARFEEPDGMDGVLDELRSSVPVVRGSKEWQKTQDERVCHVLDWLDELETAGQWDSVSLKNALATVHLSRSRFLHLFSAQVGSPWRTYLVWRRALVAITLALEGLDFTEVAYAAGYSDSAHLSRQLSALFGFTPSYIVKNSHFVQS